LKMYWSPDSNLTQAEIQQLWEDTLSNPPRKIACDTETISLEDKTAVGVGIAINANQAFYVSPDDPEFERFLILLRAIDIQVIYHNAPFDLRVLRQYSVQCVNVDDTATLCRLNNYPAKLEEVSWYTGVRTEDAGDFLKQYNAKTMDQIPFELVGRKCGQDCIATYRLYDVMIKVGRQTEYYNKFNHKLFPILEPINAVGINLHQGTLNKLDKFYTQEVAFYRTVANQMGFNPGSPKQVAYMLSKRGNYLPMNKHKTSLATGEDILKKFNDPLIPLILDYRHCKVMKSTFIDKLQLFSRAHTTLSPDAITDRLTSKDMNLQNIPNESDAGQSIRMRHAFIPDDGEDVWSSWDASQVELRVLAYLSNDPIMLKIFNDPTGDIHGNTEYALWSTKGPNRIRAKRFNFAMVFGADAQTVADKIGERRVSVVAHLMHQWMLTYPTAARWIIEQVEQAQTTGYVTSMYGRIIWLPTDQGDKHFNNCSINFPIQCSAGEIWKLVMLEVPTLGVLDKVRIQVHDELDFSGAVVPPKELEDISPLHVPIEVKQGPNWGDLHDVLL
jgi:DNA polymerase-1